VIGMAAGAVVYGERLTPGNVAGSALILAGLALIMLAGRTALPSPT
jgi:drug/metabolite transporter (DMT)-like permease